MRVSRPYSRAEVQGLKKGRHITADVLGYNKDGQPVFCPNRRQRRRRAKVKARRATPEARAVQGDGIEEKECATTASSGNALKYLRELILKAWLWLRGKS